MAELPDVSPLDLAALIASKVCHDIISPVGALANGLEVLAEDESEDMRGFAMDLIQKSSAQASAKLKFARIAFGAGGSAGATIDTGDAESVAVGYMEFEKADLTWSGERMLVPKTRVKLLLNMIYLATHCVPRGGSVGLSIEGRDENATFRVRCVGPRARLPKDLMGWLGGTHEGEPTASDVQPLYTLLLAREAGLTLTAELDGDDVVLAAA